MTTLLIDVLDVQLDVLMAGVGISGAFPSDFLARLPDLQLLILPESPGAHCYLIAASHLLLGPDVGLTKIEGVLGAPKLSLKE